MADDPRPGHEPDARPEEDGPAPPSDPSRRAGSRATPEVASAGDSAATPAILVVTWIAAVVPLVAIVIGPAFGVAYLVTRGGGGIAEPARPRANRHQPAGLGRRAHTLRCSIGRTTPTERKDLVVCSRNRQPDAGTRRVHQAGTCGHSRTRATRLEAPICRRNVNTSARPCMPVPPGNLHGKECHEEGPPRVTRSGLSSRSYREEPEFNVVRRFGSQPQASRLPSARR
jgi:hypothetical protein